MIPQGHTHIVMAESLRVRSDSGRKEDERRYWIQKLRVVLCKGRGMEGESSEGQKGNRRARESSAEV